MNELKPNLKLAKATLISVTICMILNFAQIISGYFELRLYQEIQQGYIPDKAELNFSDSRSAIVNDLAYVFRIISGVIFLIWLFRAYNNLRKIGGFLFYSNSWVVGSWFVPFVNLVRPFKIVKEIHEETDKLLDKYSNDYTLRSNFPLLLPWWILWLISWLITGMINYLFFKVLVEQNTLELYILMFQVNIIHAAVGIALAVITFSWIKSYSDMEKKLWKLFNEKNKFEAKY